MLDITYATIQRQLWYSEKSY